MTDKFIPFNPETAKNGDTVYYFSREAIYVGNNPTDSETCFMLDKEHGNIVEGSFVLVKIKAPKKTVWVNLVKYGLCGIESSVFACEKIAKGKASTYAGDYLGTFPLEIDDVA